MGVIGLGHIGQKVAKIAQAFGMEVICWSPHMTQQRAEEYGVKYVSKDVLLQSADVISLHLVLSETTKHILDTNELNLCKQNVCIVNTARAELVNQDALLSFLRDNSKAIYATDVFEQEPITEEHPFFGYQNILMTGHWGFVCDEVLEGFTKDVQKQLNDFCLLSEKGANE